MTKDRGNCFSGAELTVDDSASDRSKNLKLARGRVCLQIAENVDGGFELMMMGMRMSLMVARSMTVRLVVVRVRMTMRVMRVGVRFLRMRVSLVRVVAVSFM